MTSSEHAALSAELARALGWKDISVTTHGYVLVGPYDLTKGIYWRGFSYRHADVCLPLIEWLYIECGAVIERESGLFWVSVRPSRTMRAIASGNTLPEAVARAVIAVKKGKS